MAVSQELFDQLVTFIVNETGIVLEPSKMYLIENRLMPLLVSQGVADLHELYRRATRDIKVKQLVLDAVTTNETYFFRDGKPFDILRNHLIPELFNDGNRACNIWSAACSTGQEAYSIAMTLKEILLSLSRYQVKITGTDISTEAVNRANRGIFTQFELNRGLSEKQQQTYFTPYHTSGYKIDDEIRSVVQFKQANLLTSPIQSNQFDIVFCRNVAIYFSSENKRKLFERIHMSLKPEGKLLIGSTESIYEYSDLFERQSFHDAVYYLKK